MAHAPFYVSTYCNKAHNLKTGRPIEHECYVIPPAALQAEREGDYRRAQELMQNMKRKPVRGGGTFSGLLSGVSSATVDAFDYIMNYEPAYKKLGEAVHAAEKDAAEIERDTGVTTSAAFSMEFDRNNIEVHRERPKWYRLAREALKLARAAFKKSFPESGGIPFKERWVSQDISAFDLMSIALKHRDQFGSTGLSGLAGAAKGRSRYEVVLESGNAEGSVLCEAASSAAAARHALVRARRGEVAWEGTPKRGQYRVEHVEDLGPDWGEEHLKGLYSGMSTGQKALAATGVAALAFIGYNSIDSIKRMVKLNFNEAAANQPKFF